MSTVAFVTQAKARHRLSYQEAIRDVDAITAAVLVDPTGTTFEESQVKIGGKFKKGYPSVAEMLRRKERPAMAIVSLIASEAPAVIASLLEAGIPVMAEKPACVKPADFARLVELGERRGAPLMLALANRLAPWVEDARRIVQGGGIGKLYAVRGLTLADQTRIWTKPDWALVKAQGGGGHLIWLGVHWLDALTFITGDRITAVQAMCPLVGGASIDVEDLSLVNFTLASGAHGTLTAGYLLDRWYQQDMTFWGAQGWVRFGAADKNELEWHGTHPAMNENPDRRFTYNTFGGGYTPWIRECLRASLGEIAPPITGADGLSVLRTIFAAYAAAASGRTVQV
ncbi:MAG: Gfo/Idh/MocA family oxidoreductase [Actinobacteria bacterium]|nr:Gfo/Idh/MocA family oxidoreductase [Actinomycetota bacterium]